MKKKTIFTYLSIPAALAVGVFVYALYKEPFSVEMMSSVLFGVFLFYASPFIVWAIVVAAAKPSNVVAHSGFIASIISLTLVASFWFLPPDPSGLPLQWMLYWPLSMILLIVIPGGTVAYKRIIAPNKAPQPTAKRGG